MHPGTLLREALVDGRTAFEPLLVYHDVGPYAHVLEDELRRRIVYWRGSSLDSAFFWWDTWQRISGPGGVSESERDALLDLVCRHWRPIDDGTGAFCEVEDGEPSVYASRIALGIVKLALGIGLYEKPLGYAKACEALREPAMVDKTISFVLSCRAGGGFRTSHRCELPPTTRSTHSAYFFLWDLEQADEEIAVGVDGFLSSCFVPSCDSGGFAETPGGSPVACATYYALSATKTTAGAARIDEYRDRVAAFLRSCWDQDLGGFRATTPNFRDLKPTLPHTVFSVESLRRMLHFDSLEEVGVSTQKVLGYIQSCRALGGYRFRPTFVPGGVGRYFSPNIFATRQAVVALRVLDPRPSEELNKVRDELPAYRVDTEPTGYLTPSKGIRRYLFGLWSKVADWALRPADPLADMRFTPLHLYGVALVSLIALFILLVGGLVDRRLWPFKSDVAWPFFCGSLVMGTVALGEIALWHVRYKRKS